jgi:hypothetical protein
METEIKSVGTDINFGRVVYVTFHAMQPAEVKGGRVTRVDYDGCSVEAPAVAVRLYTSRYEKGFIDGFFRLNEGNDLDPPDPIWAFDGDFVKEHGLLYRSKSFVSWDEGIRHHIRILDEVANRFARHRPRFGGTLYF